MLFQVSHAAIRSPYLALQPESKDKENANDKFGSTNPFFANTASVFAHWQINVDLFVFSHGKGQFKNVQTFSELAKKSNGNFFFYPEYN